MDRPLPIKLIAETHRATIAAIKEANEELATQIRQLRERRPNLRSIVVSRTAEHGDEVATRNADLGVGEIVAALMRRNEDLVEELARLVGENGVELAKSVTPEDGDEVVVVSATQQVPSAGGRMMLDEAPGEAAGPLTPTLADPTTGVRPYAANSSENPKQRNERIPHNIDRSILSSLEVDATQEALAQLRQTPMGHILTEHPRFLDRDYVDMWRRTEPEKWDVLERVCGGRPTLRLLRRMLLDQP